jgi:hypothetical protein
MPATVAERAPSIEGLVRFELLTAHLEPSTSELYLRYRRRSG